MTNVSWLQALVALIVLALLDWLLLPALAGLLPGVIITLLHVVLVILMILAALGLVLGLYRAFVRA